MSARPSGSTGPEGAVAPRDTPGTTPGTSETPGTPDENDVAGHRDASNGRPARPTIDLDRPWALHPQVALRPEPFGALLYHFGTRRLSFLKDRRLVEVVRRLPDAPSARAACADCGILPDELPRFRAALATLAASAMLVETT